MKDRTEYEGGIPSIEEMTAAEAEDQYWSNENWMMEQAEHYRPIPQSMIETQERLAQIAWGTDSESVSEQAPYEGDGI